MHVLARVANYSKKLHKKHSIRLQHTESDSFTERYIVRLLSACELVLPPHTFEGLANFNRRGSVDAFVHSPQASFVAC